MFDSNSNLPALGIHCQTGCCLASGCWSWTLVLFRFMSTNTCDLREALLSLCDRSPLDCPCFDPCLMDCWLSFFHALQWTAAEVSTRFFPCIPGDVCPPFLSPNACFCPVSLHVRFPLYVSVSFFPFLPWLSTATVVVRYSGGINDLSNLQVVWPSLPGPECASWQSSICN